jgi:pimeloyl-ACP methyl ester carboxylesterase
VKRLVGDIEVGFDDMGTGLPVLLVHGFPLHRGMWQPQIAALLGQCRCIVPDLRGFGETQPVGHGTMESYADDLVHLLDHLHVDRAVVCGLSMGGYITLAMWRRHRDRIRGLVLADTKAGADGDEARARRRQMIDVARTKGSAAVAEMQLPGMLGKTTREKQPALDDQVRALMSAAPPASIVAALEGMMARPDSADLLPTIDVPTLVIVGDEDALTPVKESRAMHEAIPGSRLEIIEGAGHMSNLERPAAFNTILSGFVGGLLYN